MHLELSGVADTFLLASSMTDWAVGGYQFLKVLIGFSIIIFVHELGHFLAAKWMGIRVDRFAVGFFYRLVGYRRGEGLTFGRRPTYSLEELGAKGYGETDYCLNAFPLGGYVKMLGQDDIQINEETGEVKTSDDPRAFTNKPVSRRMFVVSAGVVFNILFAILIYVFVFLGPGKEMLVPAIGYVKPGSAAANAGVRAGDRVLAIDGNMVRSFDDIGEAWVLADDEMRLRVERDGKPLDKELVVHVDKREGQELAGMAPKFTVTLGPNVKASPDGQGPQPGDRITHVSGIPIATGAEITVAFERCAGADVEFTVQRAKPAPDGTPQIATYTQRPLLDVTAAQPEGTESRIVDSKHLLGFRRRRHVSSISEGYPAAEAGFQVGDVIVQWDNVPNALYSDIISSIYANDGTPVPVTVERKGKRLELTVTPRASVSLLGSERPKVGIGFGEEDRRAVVADVAPGTPAAALGMPRGAEIVAIDQHPVQGWFEVYEALRVAAGTTVAVRYRSGEDEAVGRMAVPSSIVDELELPPTVWILSIEGEDSVTLSSGTRVTLPSVYAVEKLLEKNVGRTVTVEYVLDRLHLEPRTTTFAVRSDNCDPWQLRVQYGYEFLSLAPLRERVTAGGNPFTAVVMGGKQTYRVLWGVYQVMKSMLTRTGGVSVKNVAGPVGIFKVAIRQAEAGYVELLFFLAFISINLAVINFLPIPVVDGGLMVFLLLEKFRGKPLSLKMQVITTLTGLGLIVLVFLFVTIQDISRLFS